MMSNRNLASYKARMPREYHILSTARNFPPERKGKKKNEIDISGSPSFGLRSSYPDMARVVP